MLAQAPNFTAYTCLLRARSDGFSTAYSLKDYTLNVTLRVIFYRKLVEQTMMEHENTKEARKKLQEYKQKLGKTRSWVS